MKLLDLSLKLPEENLALDEALLDACEEGGEEVLRFWESETVFAVVGYSNKVTEEMNLVACKQNNVGIFRRSSGGGTVLQGPGCLNYSLILHTQSPGLESVTGTNQFIMARLRTELAKKLHKPVTIEGHTDLAIEGLKFSGNAQRRKKTGILFHGTFLLNFDFEKIEALLQPPPRQPEYRQNRSHRYFVMNLKEDAGTIKAIVSTAWKADKPLAAIPREMMRRLIEEKYSKDEWNFKF